MTLTEALANAERAKALLDEASDLLHDISLARITPTISDTAYRCDKDARTASMSVFCNYAGLIDRIKAEMNADPAQ